jgi:hypothetical protein
MSFKKPLDFKIRPQTKVPNALKVPPFNLNMASVNIPGPLDKENCPPRLSGNRGRGFLVKRDSYQFEFFFQWKLSIF